MIVIRDALLISLSLAPTRTDGYRLSLSFLQGERSVGEGKVSGIHLNRILAERHRRTMTGGRISEPASKRRKLDPSGSQPQSQPSFADVLQKLKEEAGEDSRMCLSV